MDESQFPLVLCSITGELEDSDYEAMFSGYERIARRGQPHVMITDVRAMTKVASAKRRQQMAERLEAIEKKYGDLNCGRIVVVNNAVVRGALTALFWLMGKRRQEIVVSDMNAALEAAQNFARESGLSIPESAQKLVI